MNKKQLYESIMRNVAGEVKKALNEDDYSYTTKGRPINFYSDNTTNYIPDLDYNGYIINSEGTLVVDKDISIITSNFFYELDNRKKASICKVVIPESVYTIKDYAFSYFINLKSIDIPHGVKDIGKGAFYRCSSLTSIKLPTSIHTIGEGAFAECRSLVFVDSPSAYKIEETAFYNCTSLIEVHLRDVSDIEEGAFSNCAKYMLVYIGQTLEEAKKRLKVYNDSFNNDVTFIFSDGQKKTITYYD